MLYNYEIKVLIVHIIKHYYVWYLRAFATRKNYEKDNDKLAVNSFTYTQFQKSIYSVYEKLPNILLIFLLQNVP